MIHGTKVKEWKTYEDGGKKMPVIVRPRREAQRLMREVEMYLAEIQEGIHEN